MPPTLANILVGFVIVGLGMVVVERLRPGVRGRRLLRRGWLLDCCYWLFTPLVTERLARWATILVIVAFALSLGWGLDPVALAAGFGPVARQPRWLQAVELIVLLDFIGYWMHRLFHGRRLWRFHAIHHSSEELDWLAALRVHPVNDILNRIVPAIVLLLAGFSAGVVAGVLPVFAIYAILLHANVSWDFGPLRRVIASPAFHRWHHTSEAEGMNRNFAGLLPVWDIVFGTYYMPGRQPVRFGVTDAVPSNLVGQLTWPFRRRPPCR